MSIEVYMPRLGLTMKEGTIVSWLKHEGEAVSKGDSLAEIVSEKISNVVEAPGAGIVDKLLFPEGETVASGSVIAYIKETNEPGVTIEKTETKQCIHCEDPDRELQEVIPLTGVRKVIAERMSESLRRSPQASVTARVDMSGLAALKETYASQNKKYTYTDFMVKIIALALQENPLLNSSVQEGKLLVYRSVNIGVAVAAGNSLIVPVIKNVQDKNLSQIAGEIRELTRKAREGSLEPEELQGGTFTFSNMGMFNVDVMTPILNPPEAAILALGTAAREVVVNEKDDSWQIKPMATLSLTIDHAATDGMPAAKFLGTVRRLMADPLSYLN